MQSTSHIRLLITVFFASVLLGGLMVAASPAEAAPFCAYNSTQASCACPTTGPGTDCGVSSLLYNPSNGQCYTDPRSCGSNQRLDCGTGSCVCNTPVYPCTACQVATSTTGTSCASISGCPVPFEGNPSYQGEFANRCTNTDDTYSQNAFRCPSPAYGDSIDTTWCQATTGVTYPNTCVPTKTDCPEGTTWNACSNQCETATVLLDPDPGFWPSGQGGGIVVTGDIETTGGDFVTAGNVTATGYCIGTECKTNWEAFSQWTLAGNDIYNNNTNNVGIGTTVPQSKLHIEGSGTGFGLTLINQGNTVGRKGMRMSFDNDRLTFQRASDTGAWEADLMSIDQNSGWVGIGTTSPINKIDVPGFIQFDPSSGSTVLGQTAGQNSTGSSNTFVGYGAGYGLVTGTNTVAIGRSALYSPDNTSATANVAVGYGSLYDVSSSYNIGVGYFAGRYASYMSVSAGYYAGYGRGASFGPNRGVNIGGYAGRYDDSVYAVHIGYQAGNGDVTAGTGNYNIAVGYRSLYGASGAFNVAVGGSTLDNVTTGTQNVGIGYNAGGTNLTTGSYNTFVGPSAGLSSTTQHSFATALGYAATAECDNCVILGSNDRVGIGTSAPNADLDIQRSSGNAEIDLKTGTLTHWGIYHDGNPTSPNYKSLVFWNGDNRLMVGDTGDVSSSGCFGPVFVGRTSSSYTGDVGSLGGKEGYRRANDICAGQPGVMDGSHVCSTAEILESIKCDAPAIVGTTWPASSLSDAWIQDGPPGFTAPANDCRGWTSASPSDLGRRWRFNETSGGDGALTTCQQNIKFACCK